MKISKLEQIELLLVFSLLVWNLASALESGLQIMKSGLRKVFTIPLGASMRTNGETLLKTQFAAAKAGIVLVNVNPSYKSAELAYVLKMCDIRALVSDTFYNRQVKSIFHL